MADESARVTALSADKLRRLMARLSEREGTAAGISHTPRGGALPLSFAQERLWFLERLGRGGGTYHIPAAVRLRGALDAAALERTFAALVQRHEALRTTFGERDGTPNQTVQAATLGTMPDIDLSGLPDAARENELARISREEACQPFDLALGPLLRTVLVRLGPGDHMLVLTLHHIITDGWSLGVLIREVAALYPGFAAGSPSLLPELPIQPADHAVWERERLRGETLARELAFWRERLAGMPSLELPADRPRPATPSFRGALATLNLALGPARALEDLAQRERATPFIALLALFQALLLRYTGQDDFGVGTPVANRTRSEVEGLIGLFVNTLVLRADLSGEPSFSTLLRRTRDTTLEAFAHAELPFDKLVEELRPEREASRNPFFQVLFTLQNQPWPALRVGKLDLELDEIDTGTARADLTLNWRQREEGGLTGTLEYATDLFERAFAERLLTHMAELLRGALAEPERRVWDLPLLAEAERRQILGEWRGSTASYPREATVHELFEAQAALAGDRVAVEAGGLRLSYAEIETRANRLARRLRRLGVGPESTVGLAVPRSPEMVVGLLGILKAGGAYLPLDAADPRERLAALIGGARPRALVTLEPHLDRLPGGLPTVCLDRDREALAAEAPTAVTGGATADNLVYVLYTSGSTGKPKGVAVPHRAVVRLVRGGGFAHLDAGQTFLQLAPLSFDASTLEIWGPLCNGGRLAIAPPGPPSVAELGRLLTRHIVTTLWLTAGLFHSMIDEGIGGLSGLSQLLAGGDVLSPLHVRQALAALPGCTLVNGYGPTENTTFTCCHPLTAGVAANAAVPIGRPIGNTWVALLDRAGNPVPVGVPGELHAGGDGLARGYLGRPDLTAERFIPNPLADAGDGGSRLYRTGDLARWRPDGALDFLGRIDQQVKIRGFRIEPGEIETTAAAHPGVAECAVVVQGTAGNDRRLVAWFTGPDGAVPESAELRAWLAARLPAYMVPAALAPLPALPLTANGKVDRRALVHRQPPSTGIGGGEPETALERRISTVWSDLLGQPRIGRGDDFFALGGHSLLATRVISRLRQELGVELPLLTLFENPSLKGFAAAVERGADATPGDGPIPVAAGADGSELPLSFSQERLWFLDRLRPGGVVYNVPAAVRLSGALDPGVLAACFGEIARRHSTLRATFPITDVDGEPRQRLAPPAAGRLPLADLAGLPEEARRHEALERSAAEATAPFDLAAGPLLRTTLLRLGRDEHLLLLTLHHIVADGWSVGILIREVAALYEAFTAGRPSPLPELPIQYADFAIWQRRRLSGDTLASELRFWSERLRGAPPELALPADRPRPAVAGERGASGGLLLPAETTDTIHALALRSGATPFMVLIAAFAALLSRLSGQSDLTIGTPVAGRERAEVEGLIGFFVNTLVLRADLTDATSFTDLVAQIRHRSLAAFSHQELPFEKLVEALQPERDTGRTPLFQAFFALQNAPAEPLRLPGLAVEPVAVASETAKFDLALSLAEDGEGFAGELRGSADLFEATTVLRWAGFFEHLLTAALRTEATPVSDLPLLSDEEHRQLLLDWGPSAAPVPDSLLARIEAWADRTPLAPAVVAEDETLTWRELDERANRLAWRLRELEVGPGAPIAICLDRSAALVTALLGVLKAGGAYVPLDPDLPAGRLAALLANCGALALIATEPFGTLFPAGGPPRLAPEPAGSPERPEIAARPQDLAYVIYTSGSTGMPKGVMVEQRQLAAYVDGLLSRAELPDSARYATVSTFAADLGHTAVFASLATGGALHVPSRDRLTDPDRLASYLESHPVDLLKIVPSHLAALLSAERPERVLPRRLLVLGGEAAPWSLVERVRELAPGCRVLNHYGPTETTVGVLTFPTWAEDGRRPGAATVPLGRPLPGARAVVVDRRLRPVPAALAGELLIGGSQVSRGYLGRPDLTAERFVPDPFGGFGERLYRTGDRVRRLPGGDLQFLGRIDQQLKIRGFRIEPGEVEAALRACPEVKDAVVGAYPSPSGEPSLVAWVVPAGGAPSDLPALLRAALRQRLPDAMIPGVFIPLAALPLTANGKLDRRALPAPVAGESGAGHEVPRTPSEEIVAAIYSELLGLPRVGRNEGFFELGGHSLLAMRALSRLRRVFGAEIDVRALFESPTVAGLAARLEREPQRGLPPVPPLTRHSPPDGPAPLSFAQERLWLLAQIDPESAAYNVPRVVDLNGELASGRRFTLAAVLSEIRRRHETLRTVFAADRGNPIQRVLPHQPAFLPMVDLSALPAPRHIGEAEALTFAEAGRPFDLAADPPLRQVLLRLDGNRHRLLLTMHHIASDGWSTELLLRELAALWAAFSAGHPSPLPELPVQYSDYARWQRRWLTGEALRAPLDWWRLRLANLSALELPADGSPRPAASSGRAAAATARALPAPLAAGLASLVRREGATLFMALLAGFQGLLCRYSGQTDVAVGTPVANREPAEVEPLIGFFVNTLVLRTDLAGDPSFSAILTRAREAALGAYAHQEAPFERVVEEFLPRRGAGHETPLFRVMLAFVHAASGELRLPGLEAFTREVHPATAKFDLTLVAEESGAELALTLEYREDLFASVTAARLLQHLEVLLDGALARPETPLSELPLLGPEEREQIFAAAANPSSYPRDLPVHSLFAAQAARGPGQTALSAPEEEVTYAELESCANRLAHHLRAIGVGGESPVGVALDRSTAAVVAFLAILKAGGAYVPLDSAFPPARLAQMAQEVSLPFLITEERRLAGPLAAAVPRARAICLDRDAAAVAARSATAPEPAVPAGALAYIMFTSGSTGEPKAVGVEHRAVVRLVRGADYADFGPGETFLQLAPLSFDAATLEIWGPLLNGGRLAIPPAGTLSLEEIAETLEEQRVTTLWLTAGLFHEMVARRLEGLRGVRQLLAGGDVLSPEAVDRMLAAHPDCRLINGYGPTENTTFTCCHTVRAPIPPGASVPIGRPIANTTIYVLDGALQAVPDGVPGELFAGGDGLSRGYLGRPGLTAERFVPDPFGGFGERLYRTGDHVRRRRDGELEFLGRADQQVKIRGFRIEPGEIEAALTRHPGVAAAAVVAREGPGGRRLAAYVVPAAPGISVDELPGFLRESLPDPMVPSLFTLLPSLPLTPAGKVDRRALPHPAEPEAGPGESFVAPRTTLEKTLAAIWAGVLQVDQVGAFDDFFERGGHSLLAVRVLSLVQDSLGVRLPVRTLFDDPELAVFAAHVAEEIGRSAGEGGGEEPIRPRAAGAGPLPLSFSQERLWFLEQLEPGNAAYNVTAGLRLRGRVRRRALAVALEELAVRHESLRTTFVESAGRPFQVVAPAATVSLPLVDLGVLAAGAREAELTRLATEQARRPFDLARGPMIRNLLVRLGAEDHGFICVLHHIVSDGWSSGILVRELSVLYDAFSGSRPSPLPALPIQYPDYALWQRERLRGEALAARLAYWRERLAGLSPLEMPTDRPRPAVAIFGGGRRRLASLRDEGLRELVRRRGASLFMALLAVFEELLHRYSRQEDFGVGSPVANRDRSELEGLIGFFVNSVVLRAEVAGDPSFSGLLDRVRETTLAAYAHQDLPFERVVEELQPERDLSRSPLFQVMLSLQNAPFEPLRLPNLTLEPLPLDGGTAKFEILLSLVETAEGLTGEIEYNADLFDGATIERLRTHFATLLAEAVAAPDRKLSELPLLSAAERSELLAWNDTGEPGPASCLHELFEVQAARTPNAVALIDGTRRWTYRDLDERAGLLARRLVDMGVGPEVTVGVCLDRTGDLPAALLAVLKAGGAYVPLDPAYPRERLAFMLEDSRASVLLARSDLAGSLGQGIPTLGLDSGWPGGPAGEILSSGVGPGNLAYVIYTSGSTGRPKGVAVEHRNAAALVDWARRTFSAEELAGVLAATSVCFDLSVFELFAPLATGGTAILAANTLETPDLPAAGEITLINTVPSAIAVLARQGGIPASVRTINLAGEPLKASLVREVREGSRAGRIWNLYGPTEDTTYSTAALVEPMEAREPPIGQPLPGTRAHVLDPSGREVPVGVPGELYLAGAGLARGYLGRPDLTAGRFVPDPFSAEPGARLYRTGDLARRQPGGDLDFLGRLDHQVKIRGVRVELGEVESALVAHPAVREAVALVREEDGDRALVAWVVPAHPAATAVPEPAALREHLRSRLPEAMVPSAFVVLDALPLTPNGKLDRKALPSPQRTAGEAGGAPRNSVEEILTGIWSEVLRVGRTGIHDDFFTLGGHSLLATQVISRVRTVFAVELPLKTVFERPTVAGLAAAVEARRRGGTGEVPPFAAGSRPANLPLSFAQQRLWFLDRLEPGSLYNIPAALRLEGTLAMPALAGALAEIVRRHEVLRTTFPQRGGLPVQEIAWPPPSRDPASLPVVDLEGVPTPHRQEVLEAELAREAAHPFDLVSGPLLRIVLFRLGDREHVLSLAVHHIVADAWSIGVFVRELGELYSSFAAGLPSPFAELPLQYADFALWQRGWLTGAALDHLIAAWRERLAGAPAALELPTDRPRPAVQTFRGASLPVRLGPETAEALRALSRHGGTTLFMTLLAAFAELFHRYSGQDDLVVGTPIAGRGRREIEGLIGLFLNTLALRTDLSGDPAFNGLLARTRAVALDAYALQDLPFEKLVEELQPVRDFSRAPIFQTMLVLQNAPLAPLELPGLALSPLPLHGNTAKFDLLLSLAEADGAIAGRLEYNTGLFDPPTIERLLAHFAALLGAAAAAPERRLSELPMLSAAERRELLAWNDTGEEEPAGCLHELFEVQARLTPDAVALIDGLRRWTYRELDERADLLARRLARMGVWPEVRVAVCLHRTADLPAALLGVLKAGGAYVPLDPALPRERLAFMLADSGAALLVAGKDLALGFPGGIPTLTLEDGWSEGPERCTPFMGTDPGHLAYVIYTSGSTGRPKGVAIEHRSAAALIGWARRTFSPGELAGVLAATSVGFDLSVFELFAPLSTGGTVILAANALELPSLPAANEVTLVNTVPSAIAVLARQDGIPPSVRTVNLGGEPLKASLVREVYERSRVERVWNLYGPTEDTTYSTASPVGPFEAREPVIGGPLPGTRAYVLDPGGQEAPVGVPGELFLAGAGLARGYLGRPDLTAERFVPDPRSPRPGTRLYRTGDRVRRLPDGNLDFLGRLDHQVKIRGVRMELGEVESVLAAHPAVREAVALVRDDSGDRRLVAWIVPADGAAPEPAVLREYLRAKLPEAMVPGAFVVLDALPLTPNGKLDRKALPAPERPRATAAYEMPRSGLEQTVAGLWQELLRVERIGLHDNFFELGGHSLLMASLQSRLQETLDRNVAMVDLFSHPTVDSLARFLTDGDAMKAPVQAEKRAERGRSRIQQLQQGRKASLHMAILEEDEP